MAITTARTTSGAIRMAAEQTDVARSQEIFDSPLHFGRNLHAQIARSHLHAAAVVEAEYQLDFARSGITAQDFSKLRQTFVAMLVFL